MKKMVIDNTEWIQNMFNIGDKVFFIDNFDPNEKTVIYSITKKIFLENLKLKNGFNSEFLSCPNNFKNIDNKIMDSDLEIEVSTNGFVFKIFELSGVLMYIIISGNEIKTYNFDGEQIHEFDNYRYLDSFDSHHYFGQNNGDIYIYDNKMIKTEYEGVNIMEFENNIIWLTKENNIYIKTKNNNEKTEVIESDSNIRFCRFDQKNVIISYDSSSFEKRTTCLQNLTNIDNITTIFDDYLYKTINLNQEYIMGKPGYLPGKKRTTYSKIIVFY